MRLAKKSLYNLYILAAVIMVLVTSGCEKAYVQFGDQFVDNNYTNVVMVDTIMPVISTVFRDSIVTSSTGKVLAGSYKDPIFGQISTASFFVMGNPALPDLHISAMYDSLTLRLQGDSTFYGDSSVVQRLQVQQLNEMILFGDNETSLYDVSDFSTSPTVLGSAWLNIRPSQKDSFHIRLNDSKGTELWNLIKNKATEVTTATDFEHYFKGLKLSPENASSNAAIYGFYDTIVMRLYYHEANPNVVEKYIDFNLVSQNKQFNQVRRNRSGTVLDVTIPEGKEIPSASLANAAYIQPLTGAVMKMTFPTIRNAMLQRTDYLQMLSAELVIKPVGNSYSPYLMLPSQLTAYTTNINNLPGSMIGLLGASGSNTPQYGDLTIDWLYGQDTYYTYDLSSYLQQQILLSGDNTNGLLFFPPSPAYNTLFNRVVIGDRSNAAAPKLKVYYISVQQD